MKGSGSNLRPVLSSNCDYHFTAPISSHFSMKPKNLFWLAIALPAISHAAPSDQSAPPPSTPEQQRAMFHLPPGFEIQLVAAEPEIQKPLNLTFDAAGRLWVTGSEMYPWPAATDAEGKPIPDFTKAYNEITAAFGARENAPPASVKARDSVRVLSDFDESGHAQKISIFADGVNIPSGVQPLPRKPGAKGDSAIVYSIPNIYRLEDTDGDGHADKREVLYGTAGFLDTHGGMSSFLYWIDGWIYGTHGFRNRSEIRDKTGKVTVLESGNTYRFRDDGSAFELVTHGQTNPFGLTTDTRGNFYSADSHSKPVYLLLRGGWYEGLGKHHDGLGFAPRITDDDHGSTAIAGITYYAADSFPEEYRENLFNGNVVTQRINRDKLEWHGSSPKAIRQPDFLTCDDPWFRPVQVKLGPDGALYIADFYNPIIGHYEFPLTDPRRDHSHGRIWRVVWKGGQQAMPDLSEMGADGLVNQLSDPNLIIRTLATNQLAERTGLESSNALKKALAANSEMDGAARSHVLWAGERLGIVDDDLLEQLFKPSNSDELRIHVCKILADRLEITPAQEKLLATAVLGDDSPVARAAAEALGLHPCDSSWALVARLHDTSAEDQQLIYTLRMTLRDLLKVPGSYAKAIALENQHPEYATSIADVSLGLPTPESASYLLSYLRHQSLQCPRGDELLHHVILHLPEDKLRAVPDLLQGADDAPLTARVGIAENSAKAYRIRGLAMPKPAADWVWRTLSDAIESPDDAMVMRALEGLREMPLDEKLKPLGKLASDPGRSEALRAAALDALANAKGSGEILAGVLQESSSPVLRKRAAELLRQQGPSAFEPLLAALPTASSDLATTIAAGLVISDEGFAQFLDLIEQGKAPASLLRNTSIAEESGKRDPALQVRVAALTKDLPPENERLNQLIANRVASFQSATPDIGRGREVFTVQCAICHQVQGNGTNIGPALDGIGTRGFLRLAEDILDPNRNVDPMFRQTLLTTTDDQVVAGLNLQQQGELLTLTDVSGKSVSVPKETVKSQTTSTLSLMPAAFETTLPEQDFNDLMAYLLSMREK